MTHLNESIAHNGIDWTVESVKVEITRLQGLLRHPYITEHERDVAQAQLETMKESLGTLDV